MKKFLGIILLIIGIIMIVVSIYIKTELGKGREKVGSAKEKVEMGKSIFSLTPQTKELGKGLTQGVEKKIAEGEEEIAKYAKMANLALYGGAILVVIGAVMLFLPSKKK